MEQPKERIIGQTQVGDVTWRVSVHHGSFKISTGDDTQPRYVLSADIPPAVFELLLEGSHQCQSHHEENSVAIEAADLDELLEPPELQPVRGALNDAQTAPHIEQSLREAVTEDGLN